MSVAIVKAETVRIARPGRLGPIKDIFASPIECRQAAKALIQTQKGVTFVPLFIDIKDTKVTDEHIRKMQGAFSLGKITTDAIVRMAPGILELAYRLSEVQAIAISSRYPKGGTISKPGPIAGDPGRLGRYLLLDLDQVLIEIGEKEKTNAERTADNAFETGKTIIKNDGGSKLDERKAETIVWGYHLDPGAEMFRFAVHQLFPLNVGKMYQWERVVEAFGEEKIAAEVIGEYEPEFAAACRLNLDETKFSILQMSLTKTLTPKERAEHITAAIKSCGGAYLLLVEGGKNQLERDLDSKLKKWAVEIKYWLFKTTLVDVYRAILKNNRIGLGKEDAAILALMVASRKISKERAINFVSRAPEKEIGDYIGQVKAHAAAEESRIFTLRKVISALIALGS